MMKKILILFLFFVTSCNSYSLQEPEMSDFFTTGHLSENVFQVIIRQPPSKKLKKDSIILQREDAFITARSDLESLIAHAVFDFKYGQNQNLTRSKKYYLNLFRRYHKVSNVVREYYEEDNTLVFVVRIYKKHIKKEINSLK